MPSSGSDQICNINVTALLTADGKLDDQLAFELLGNPAEFKKNHPSLSDLAVRLASEEECRKALFNPLVQTMFLRKASTSALLETPFPLCVVSMPCIIY